MSAPDPDCLFCKIVAGEIPSTQVYADDDCYAFADTNPQAPTHVLVVPRAHFTDVADLARDAKASAALLAGVRAFAAQEGLTDFRTVFNTGREVGQTVFHTHAHVLAGRPFTWPPG
ncbi:histidine triad nucleotide-binding protein [uncultured Jatrophihabitans sp.]|uniref:histidine triad nucleotide-binding protein n=1 Tax=uncultured Jatrophihabitans sp. TaxID=1610747 RepID=UPI0035C975E3